MYQNAIHFTFYHEMAHLVQKSNLLQDGLYEDLDSKEFSVERHNLELDADEFSAVSLSSHVVQYAQKVFGERIALADLEKLLVIVCSSVLLYLLSFRTNEKEIYYEKMSHPHPVIRVTAIIFVLAGHVLQILDLARDKNEMKATIFRVVNQTLSFSSGLASKLFENDLVTKYSHGLGSEAENIISYIGKLNSVRRNDNMMAVNKRNVLARQLHG